LLSAILELALDVLSEVAAALLPAGREKLNEWRRSDSPQLRIIGLLAILLGIALVAAIVAVVLAFI
jgi:hypothetical protein